MNPNSFFRIAAVAVLGAVFSNTVLAQWIPVPFNRIWTSNRVGIGINNPQMPLHIVGTNVPSAANSQGWYRGLLLSDLSTIMWEGKNSQNFFMAHSSNSPVGDFYTGISNGIGATAPVNYASHVFVTNPPVGIPQASTQIFKNLLVQEPGFTRRVGVNTLLPVNVVQINSNVISTVVNPVTSTGPTRSGLRFANLNATMVEDALSNTTGTALSVNNTGDVILVRAGLGTVNAAQNGTSITGGNTVELGQPIAAPGNPGRLIRHSEIPMNNSNLFFNSALNA